MEEETYVPTRYELRKMHAGCKQGLADPFAVGTAHQRSNYNMLSNDLTFDIHSLKPEQEKCLPPEKERVVLQLYHDLGCRLQSLAYFLSATDLCARRVRTRGAFCRLEKFCPHGICPNGRWWIGARRYSCIAVSIRCCIEFQVLRQPPVA